MNIAQLPFRFVALTHVAFFALLLLAVGSVHRFGSDTALLTAASAALSVRVIVLGLGASAAIAVARGAGGRLPLCTGLALTGALATHVSSSLLGIPQLLDPPLVNSLLLIQGLPVAVALVVLVVASLWPTESETASYRVIGFGALASAVAGAGVGALIPALWARTPPLLTGLAVLNFLLLLVAAYQVGAARRLGALKAGLLLFGFYGSILLFAVPFVAVHPPAWAAVVSLMLDCSAVVLIPAALFAAVLKATNSGGEEQSDVHAEAARRDALTGLFNRRTLDSVGPALFTGSHQLEQPISLLMIDIDHFKPVNDTHGHPAGDAVLKRFAQILATQMRVTDLVARYGGEEFAAVLPGAPLAPALRLGERIRAAVEQAEFEIGGGKILRITTSIGVATAFPDEIADFRALIATADKNLYRAKRSGRNRVMANPLVEETPEE